MAPGDPLGPSTQQFSAQNMKFPRRESENRKTHFDNFHSFGGFSLITFDLFMPP